MPVHLRAKLCRTAATKAYLAIHWRTRQNKGQCLADEKVIPREKQDRRNSPAINRHRNRTICRLIEHHKILLVIF